MSEPLELLERRLLSQAPKLIERALCLDIDRPTLIQLVEVIASTLAFAGPEAVEFLRVTEAWNQFDLLYPGEAGDIMRDALLKSKRFSI